MTSGVLRGSLNSSVTLVSTGTISPSENPLESNANYIISEESSTVFVYNVTSGSDVYSSSNVELAFETAFGYLANGQKLVVQPATYTSTTSHIDMTSCTNATVVFESGAIMTIANGLDVTVLELVDCINCTVINAQINGNGLNQNTPWLTDGILFYNCGGCLVVNATITNIYRDGFATNEDVSGHLPNGIINSTITFCGWNGITLGGGGLDTIGAYAINNTVAYCSDVGITSYGIASVIRNNTVHDMNGTTNTQAHYGIAVEENGNNIIENNTCYNCGNGVNLGAGGGNTFRYNNFSNCDSGIFVSDAGNNVITQNTVTNWGETYSFGIALYWGYNNSVSFNTLTSDKTGQANSFYVYNSSRNIISNNTITTLTTASSYGAYLEVNASNNVIEFNNIQAATGINIHGATCVNNTIWQNTLTNCTTNVRDTGTNTRYTL
jgi:parallel beta-helix repeat protein